MDRELRTSLSIKAPMRLQPTRAARYVLVISLLVQAMSVSGARPLGRSAAGDVEAAVGDGDGDPRPARQVGVDEGELRLHALHGDVDVPVRALAGLDFPDQVADGADGRAGPGGVELRLLHRRAAASAAHGEVLPVVPAQGLPL